MSIMTCPACSSQIDTDYDTDHLEECEQYHRKMLEESIYETEMQDMGCK